MLSLVLSSIFSSGISMELISRDELVDKMNSQDRNCIFHQDITLTDPNIYSFFCKTSDRIILLEHFTLCSLQANLFNFLFTSWRILIPSHHKFEVSVKWKNPSRAIALMVSERCHKSHVSALNELYQLLNDNSDARTSTFEVPNWTGKPSLCTGTVQRFCCTILRSVHIKEN